MPDNTISQILVDDTGRLWLGGNRGIACVNRQDFDELAAGRINTIYPQIYGLAEGMPAGECTGGFFPAGLKSKSGMLWFSTAEGVAVIDSRQNTNNSSAPIVVLEEIKVDGNSVLMSKISRPTSSPTPASVSAERLHIPPGSHRFEFQYTAMGFDLPEQVRFRYRLEGLDADWVEAGVRRTAFYNYVPPGDYRFRVSACGGDGVWSESGAGVPLAVARHFWQSWWVLGLGIAGMVFAVGGSARVVEKRKLQRRLKRLEQEKLLERERTRIARDLHDEMGAKLCRISFLTEHSRRDERLPSELREQIASISEESRDVLHSLDEIVWAVNPHNDTVEHAASYIGQYAHEYFQKTVIECEVDMPAQLPAHPLSSQTRHHLFLAVREALANILKHSEATRSKISVACRPAAFEITAWDNGHGFDKSANGHPVPGAVSIGGNGLQNMQQRMAAIGGYCQAESVRGEGTTIRFVVPLEKSDNGKIPS
jgi:signal transduction histidine kinase